MFLEFFTELCVLLTGTHDYFFEVKRGREEGMCYTAVPGKTGLKGFHSEGGVGRQATEEPAKEAAAPKASALSVPRRLMVSNRQCSVRRIPMGCSLRPHG